MSHYEREERMRSYLVFDIETCPIDDAGDYLDPVDAPSNYKDHNRIEAYKQEKFEELVARAALDCDLNRIVAVGIKRETNSPFVLLAEDEENEKQVLAAFWHSWNNVDGPKVSFHGLGFDLPVLLRRSQLLGVKAPTVSLDKYRTPVVDLMQFLTWRGVVKAKSLAFYCKRFGICVPEDEVSRRDIPALVAAGNWKAIESHCHTDVLKTAALAVRLGLISTHVPEPLEAA